MAAPVTIEQYEARQAEIGRRLAELHREYDGQAFPDAQRREWDSLNEEREQIIVLVDELRARTARLDEVSGQPESQESIRQTFNIGGRSGTRAPADIYDLTAYRNGAVDQDDERRLLRDGALRSVEQSVFPHEDADRNRVEAHIERLLEPGKDRDPGVVARRILATGSETYRRAFGKAIAGQELTTEERTALSSTAGNGGYAVPYTLDPTVIPTSSGAVNPLRAMSRTETITTKEWQGVASSGVTAGYAAQATEASDNAPTLTQPTLAVERAQAFIPYSIEIEQDWGGMAGELAIMLQDAKDELEATKFVNATGTNEPFGLLTGATTTVGTAGSGAFAVADLYTTEAALPARFVARAAWLANKGFYSRVRQFDTAGGANLWMRLAERTSSGQIGEVSQGANAELLGYPAWESTAINTTNVLTTGTKIAVFGDFARYFLIVDRIGMNVEVVPHLFGASNRYPTGQRGLYAYWRNNAKVLAAGAFRTLVTT